MPNQDRPLRFRELVTKLKRFGIVEHPQKGKGSIKKFIGVVEGRKQGYSIHAHSENDEIDRHYLRAIRDRFKIPADAFYDD